MSLKSFLEPRKKQDSYLVKGSSGTSLHGGVDHALAGPVGSLQNLNSIISRLKKSCVIVADRYMKIQSILYNII